jgi:hypothetical protein
MATSKAKDLADFISKQSSSADSILETGAMQLPAGTTGERPTAVAGMIRYNNTTTLSEYYDGSSWKSIDSPPQVDSISPTVETDANANIVVTGSNFSSSVTAKFIGADGTEYTSPTVTRNSSTQITMTTPSTALTVANEPYDIVVTNTSGLTGTLADALDAGGVPAFVTSAGSLGTFGDALRVISGTTLNASATDPDGDTITYSVTTGSLPAGLSISSSTGMITGTATAVGSNTTTTFTVSAATASDTSTRQFSITINSPVITTYTSTGSGTFSVPSGTTAVDVMLVAGGGGGGRAGGGGAGGLIYRPAFPVTPGGSVSYTLGDGGPGESGDSNSGKANGQDSTFGTLTAKGGGYGGHSTPSAGNSQGVPGGSGGGGGFNNSQNDGGGAATQPQQPGDSGTYGFGNAGGVGGQNPFNAGGGGGGAGGGGTNTPAGNGNRAKGGIGKQYGISGSQVYYAGGGGGSSHIPGSAGLSQGGQGGGGQGAPGGSNNAHPQTGYSGAVANRGGGGSAAHYNPTAGQPSWMKGGSGIIIVSY